MQLRENIFAKIETEIIVDCSDFQFIYLMVSHVPYEIITRRADGK